MALGVVAREPDDDGELLMEGELDTEGVLLGVFVVDGVVIDEGELDGVGVGCVHSVLAFHGFVAQLSVTAMLYTHVGLSLTNARVFTPVQLNVTLPLR